MATLKTSRPSFSTSPTALLNVPFSVTPGESRNFDLTTSSNFVSTGSTNDPPYLFNQFKSSEWLQRYGLKSQKLTFDQILQRIGFKRVEKYDPVVGKTITAKYAGNLYNEVQHDNGDRYVLTCRPEKLREYLQRLETLLHLLRKRLAFLNSGSRRLFGIISEPSVCLICDCKTFDYRLFNQFQSAISSLLKEQITKIKKFNIIWVSNDNEQFREQPVDVTSSNIDKALDWICDRKCSRTKASVSATCEAVLKAFKNDVESFYLISEGDSSDYAREMLRDNIVKTRLSLESPKSLNVVSLFCHNNDTQTFLRSIAQSADGSYFCYKIKSEVSDLKAPSNAHDPTRIKLQDDKLQIGTNALTPIPEYPVDIALMYKEIIECQSIIDRIEKIVGFVRDENQNSAESFNAAKPSEGLNASGNNNFQRSLVVPSSALFSSEENEMGSVNWLKIYGIDAQKLDFFSVLHAAAFRHCDGVVRVLKPPEDTDEVTDSTPANPQDKLINAIYCDQFAHVAWPDGTIRHVHVTPELHRDYERRIRALLEKIKARLKWLKKGSRDLFGVVLENNIYVLIDTSKSMQYHLSFVKDKLRQLINDQLLTKERINVVAFNSVVNPWRDRLTKISDSTTISQLQPWIDGLTTEGSTNTLGALRFALADPATEAIYLLTDGRPDQNERHILSQVQYRQTVPIHTIAFNCQDQDANQFLYNLSKQTGGRFHAFQYGLEKQPSVELPESEDVGTLKQELLRGQKELERIAALRDECLGHAWSRENLLPKIPKTKARQSSADRHSATVHLRSQSNIDFSNSTMQQRASKKKRSSAKQNRKLKSRSVTNMADIDHILNINSNQWLLPETKDYLNGNKTEEKAASDTETGQRAESAPEIRKSRTAYDDVKSYLKKNSLVAKGLTIFDVLHPTSVTVKEPRHIQVIDRYVLAKVWDDILPLTYGSYAGKLRLVNHYAVNLEKYEEKLKELIANYHQFTSNFIWKHLRDEDKRKLGASLHWQSLSKEEQNEMTSEIAEDEHTSQTALENFAWRKLTDAEQNKVLEKPVPYQDKNQTVLKDILKDAEAESAFKGVARMDVEIHRAIKFLQISTDLRQLQKRADIDSKPSAEEKPRPPSRASAAGPTTGQRVISPYDGDGFFYPGVTAKSPAGQVIVRFEIGIEQDAVGHVLLPINGAIAQPNLFVNDPVLVQHENHRNQTIWVPGLVLALPAPGAPPPVLYTVAIYKPIAEKVHVYRRQLIKISRALFDKTRLHLEYLHGLHSPPIIESGTEGRPKSAFPNDKIQSLTTKIEGYHKSHTKQYYSLKKKLERQMLEIRQLQDIIRKPPTPVIISTRSSTQSSSSTSQASTAREEDFIPPNTTVYAYWLHYDNLFYEGTVGEKQEDRNSYRVERNGFPPDYHCIIPREHIFLKTQLQKLGLMKEKSFILIQRPKDYRHCWLPAVVLAHNSDESTTRIRFYDCIVKENVVDNTKVLPISEQQFTEYTQRRIDYEKSLVNQTVVGLRLDSDKPKEAVHMLGTIIRRLESGHRFLIKWSDNAESAQEEEYLFGVFTPRIEFFVNCYVLAVDDSEYIYRIGQVKKISDDRSTLTIRFIDSDNEKIADVPSVPTFVISEEYYESYIQKLRD
ncbi:unnamed protein product [Adineta ricciae]|nr:unnamed protein product [Adineta ricciae]